MLLNCDEFRYVHIDALLDLYSATVDDVVPAHRPLERGRFSGDYSWTKIFNYSQSTLHVLDCSTWTMLSAGCVLLGDGYGNASFDEE
jgi:hypothetical protein